MKRFTLLVAMIATAFAVKAQDLIVLRNATEIQSKVVAITPEYVTYKRWSNPDGPTYTISKSEVFYIKYQNGEKDIMTEMTATSAAPAASSASVASAARVAPAAPVAVTSAKPKKAATPITPIKFSGHALVGTTFGDVQLLNYEYDRYGYYDSWVETQTTAGPTLDVSIGAKIYGAFYIGVETGFHSMIVTYGDENCLYGYVPLGVNMKGYFTRGRKVNPYLNCSLGGFIGVGKLMEDVNGFYCQVGAGFEAGRFMFGIGYSGLVKDDYTQNNGYIKLGIAF